MSKAVLFGDENIKWKSKYSPWLYVCLKLSYNYIMQHNKDHSFKINYEDYIRLFNTTRKTIYCAVRELVDKKLLIKPDNSNRYKIISENELYEKNYVIIYNNFLYELLDMGLTIRQLVIYYYLVYTTYMFKPIDGYTKSEETQSSIVRNIRSRSTEVKSAIEGLLQLGLLKRDECNHLYVLRQNGMFNAIPSVISGSIDKEEKSANDKKKDVTENGKEKDCKTDEIVRSDAEDETCSNDEEEQKIRLGTEHFAELLKDMDLDFMEDEELKSKSRELTKILFTANLTPECRELLTRKHKALDKCYKERQPENMYII